MRTAKSSQPTRGYITAAAAGRRAHRHPPPTIYSPQTQILRPIAPVIPNSSVHGAAFFWVGLECRLVLSVLFWAGIAGCTQWRLSKLWCGEAARPQELFSSAPIKKRVSACSGEAGEVRAGLASTVCRRERCEHKTAESQGSRSFRFLPSDDVHEYPNRCASSEASCVAHEIDGCYLHSRASWSQTCQFATH